VNREEPSTICANDGCARRAEPKEDYCAACGLERSLFLRDERISESPPDPGTRSQEPGISS
jgi:hypothetical protein